MTTSSNTKKVLVACEESQAITKRLRAMGIEAFSCDIKETTGEHPEWHIVGDAEKLLEKEWDAVIAFPPCTHLASSGARWFKQKQADGRQAEGIRFFMKFAKAKAKMVAIENPVGIMSSKFRKPNQIINPWQFGDEASKKTCLWLKGLPELKPTKIVGKGEVITFKSGKKMQKWMSDAFTESKTAEERSTIRSKTFAGIADAMADQWGKAILKG